MVWLRLAYLRLPEALKPSFVNGNNHQALISGRYKALLRKQFFINGVPWIYEQPVDQSKNPRHKQPKGHKKERERSAKIEKIKLNLLQNVQSELEYRQQRINNRKLGGLDRLVQKTIPSWLVVRKEKEMKVDAKTEAKNEEKKLQKYLKENEEK